MRRRAIPLLLLTVLSCGSAGAFDPDAALASYRALFAKSGGPVETDGTNLFVIVDADIPPGLPGGADRVALTEMHKSLLAWIDGGAKAPVAPSPLCPLLADFVLPAAEFDLPEVGSVVVESQTRGGRVRRATAMDLAPLAALREEVAAKRAAGRTVDEWVALLNDAQGKLKSDSERDTFLSLLGCPDALVSSEPGARCFGDMVDVADVAVAVSSWFSAKAPERLGEKDCRAVLRVVPSFAPAWERLGEELLKKRDFTGAIACRLAANAADILQEPLGTGSSAGRKPLVIADLCEKAKSEPRGGEGSPAWDEFAALTVRISEHWRDQDLGEGTNSLWRYVFRTAGHLDFLPAARGDGGAFGEAMALWRKGKDLPRIVALLRSSLEADPSRAEAWKYLGAAWRASGLPERALVAYNEAARLAPEDAETAVYQAALYQALGCPAMASGAAWRVLLLNPPEKTARIAGDILRANHADTLAPEEKK